MPNPHELAPSQVLNRCTRKAKLVFKTVAEMQRCVGSHDLLCLRTVTDGKHSEALVPVPAWGLHGKLGGLLYLSGPQFLYLKNRDLKVPTGGEEGLKGEEGNGKKEEAGYILSRNKFLVVNVILIYIKNVPK